MINGIPVREVNLARSRLKRDRPQLTSTELEKLALSMAQSNFVVRTTVELMSRKDFNNAAAVLEDYLGAIQGIRIGEHSAVVTAIEAGDDRLLQALIERGADLDAPESGMDRTPLNAALSLRKWSAALRLIEAGASVTPTNSHGWTPLQLELSQWRLEPNRQATMRELLAAFLERGVDPFSPEADPDLLAFLENRPDLPPDVLDMLLTNRPAASKLTRAGDSSLHLAAMWCRTNSILTLLHHGFSVAQTNLHGLTPMQSLASLPTPIQLSQPTPRSGTAFIRPFERPEQRNEDTLRLLLERGATLDIWSAAAFGRSSEVSGFLLADPGLVRATDGLGRTPLHYAVNRGQRSTTELLLNAGADPSAVATLMTIRVAPKQDLVNPTPLHLAAAGNHPDPLARLLEVDADPGALTLNGDSPLHLAAARCDSNGLRSLVTSGAPLNTLNKDGQTALWFAALHDRADNMELLLKAGAKPTSIADGQTLLHLAAEIQNETMMTALVENGLSLESKDAQGRTAFQAAVVGHKWTSLNILLEAGADVNAGDTNQNTALHLVCAQHYDQVNHLVEPGYFERYKSRALQDGGIKGTTVQFLMDKGIVNGVRGVGWTNTCLTQWLLDQDANPNAVNLQGQSALHLLFSSDAPERFGWNSHIEQHLRLLLSAGARADLPDQNGDTPLHLAASSATPEVVAKLVAKAGKALSATNAQGQSPLHLALLRPPAKHVLDTGHLKIVQNLLLLGSNPNLVTVAGDTPLHLAADGVRAERRDRAAPEILHALLDAKANPQTLDANGGTFLDRIYRFSPNDKDSYFARRIRNPTMGAPLQESKLRETTFSPTLKTLLARHPELARITNSAGDTLLHITVREGLLPEAVMLDEAGADASAQNLKGESPALLAVRYSGTPFPQEIRLSEVPFSFDDCLTDEHVRHLDVWLRQHPALANFEYDSGFTPLRLVVWNNQSQAAAALLNHGADATAMQDGVGTLLHVAVRKHANKVIPLLLEAGADALARDAHGLIPLHLAALTANTNAIALMLQAGVPIDTPAVNPDDSAPGWPNGWTALHYACLVGQPEAVSCLLDNHADPNITNQLGETPWNALPAHRIGRGYGGLMHETFAPTGGPRPDSFLLLRRRNYSKCEELLRQAGAEQESASVQQ